MSDIVQRVQKLLRLANRAGTAEESATAAAAAQRLIEAHKLSAEMLAIERGEDAPDEPIKDFDDDPIDKLERKSLERWRWTLAEIVCRANGCYPYYSYRYGEEGSAKPVILLIGRPTDVETARYIHEFCLSEVYRLVGIHGVGTSKVWKNNFRLGVLDTIARKLLEQRAEAESELREAASARARSEGVPAERALVAVNKAIATVAEKRASVEKWVQENKKFGKGSGWSSTKFDSSAREKGRKAGEEIKLIRGGKRLGSGQSETGED